MKKSQLALMRSGLALLLCVSMLLGSTWAWFSDSVTSGLNTLSAGTLDVELSYSKDGANWTKVTETTNVFEEGALWEPGYTDVVYLRVENAGNLALKYQLGVKVANEQSGVNMAGESFNLSEYIKFGVVEANGIFADRATARAALTTTATLKEGGGFAGTQLLKAEETAELALVVYMPEETGNVANHNGKDKPQIDLGLALVATQAVYEEDSFGSDYDAGAELPGFSFPENNLNSSVSAPVVVEGGVTTAEVVLANGAVSATVPAGVAVEEGTEKLTLTVTEKTSSESGITPGENEEILPLDVHVDGVAEDNTTPIEIFIAKAAPVGLNMGNLTLYHVQGDEPVEMTLVDEFTDHNQFKYDPATGDVTLYMASFSEVALLADTTAAWEGKFDYTWYNASKTEFTISNADQLAAFGAIVGGMDGQTKASFDGKTVTLVADVNLGDKDNANGSLIFHPIGYYYTDDKNADGTTGDYYSTVNSFEGTFNGNGHTISNFYQNTWEIKGDYAGNYYSDAMGLFGYVLNGTVKNLTVDNFSSDGEYTTTGVIAAYAANSTFENIAITNCNPRVYNTGNGGIVGIGGNSDDPDTYKLTFTNITIDNTNKITALWGSWDVACGGLVGMFRGDGHVYMTNCHVAAQIDVYNDVCGNYQYYWYRYSGMMVGTNKNMITDNNGYTVPETDKFHATDCTVHFGEWNDYYYCELVANSLASYTHDHQFSRLTQIQNVSEIQDTNGNWKQTGNFILMNGKKPTETCYHIMKDANGNLYEHKHDVADATNPEINETVNGETVLKEDKQIVYLPFNQLFTGYGWGVKHIPVYNGEDYAFKGITILDRTEATSVKKFEGKVTELSNNKEYKLGDIFNFVNKGVELVPSAVTVTVTNLDENNPVSAIFEPNSENWVDGTLTLSGTGKVEITIQDYYFCKPTTITVDVKNPEDIALTERFAVAFPSSEYINRVGNIGTVALGKLFTAEDGIGNNITIKFETVIGATVNETEIMDTKENWAARTVQFGNTGIIRATISDDNFSTPVTQYLEVVDAVNATTATSATSNNVVLLNDISSGFTVSGRYAVYGNGFTLNYTGIGQYLNNGLKQGVVTVSENGILDNLRIKASIYPAAYLYYDEVKQGPSTVEGDKTRYHYQLSAVAASDNATVSNCYIYGGRNNIFVDTGDVTIKNSILECGTLSNVQIQSTSSYTVTIENVTTIQHQVNPTLGNTELVMLGAGIIVGPDMEQNPTIVLNGTFKQYNWVNKDDSKAVTNSTAQAIIGTALEATDFNHTINGKTASNLGIIYLNADDVKVTNNTGLPYEHGAVTMMGQNGQVYSLKNATEKQIYSDYESADKTTVNGDYLPTFDFKLGDNEISYEGQDDTRYLYGDENGVTALYQEGEDPLTLDVSKLANVYKYTGINYPVTAVCKDVSGNTLNADEGKVALQTEGNYTLEFTVVDDIFYDKDGKPVSKSVKRIYTVPLNLTVKSAKIKNAEVNITKTALDGVYTTVNLTDYKLRINFLDCISITDYDNKGTGTTVGLTSNISSATLTPSGVNVFTTASTITITYTDGRVLTVNLSKISGSSPGTKTATVNTSGGVYFITDGALNNKPTEASSQNKCTITSVSFKGNNGSTVTNDTDVTVTWELGSSGGTSPCVTPDTLITLADGTQKRIDEVTYTDELLVWDFYNGEYTAKTAAIIFDHGYDYNTVIEMTYSDGTVVKAVNLHQFFDADLNTFVSIDAETVSQYVGHKFVKQDGDRYKLVTLVDYDVREEYVEAFGIISSGHYNILVEGMLSTDFMLEDYELFNYFDVGESMEFDEAKMQADIEEYGLYTYEDFADYLTRNHFEAFNVQYFKIPVGKGEYTYEGILDLIAEYLNG